MLPVMSYAYKQLSATDVELLKELLKVFGAAFNDFDAYQSAVPSVAYLKATLSKPHVIIVAALDENEVVGGLAAYELDKFEQDRREIYIYDLAVSENHRRNGIARNLINELGNIARQRKAYVIYVQADPEDIPAIRLYESLGSREDVHHFDIPVDSETAK